MPEVKDNFEQAFSRLEEILNKMNSGMIGLDESLKLYEEADGLIIACHKRLADAEQKIEIMVKNRQGQLQTNSDGKPMTQPFPPNN